MKNSQFALLTSLLVASHSWAGELDFSGYIGADGRYFGSASQDIRQIDKHTSIYIEPELYWETDDRNNAFTFKPFYRYDSEDDERTHFDIRELYWLHVGNDWEFRAGINKVFWGVTETSHLVDIVNQTDSVESFDGEEKLGQPMVQFSFIKDWGVLDLFVLPGFRERTFPGVNGRLRGGFAINNDKPLYQSSDEDKHIDFAAKWSQTYDDLDLALSWFKGTSRDPEFIPNQTNTELTPYYVQIEQIGAVLQYIDESWLWKLEAINRTGDLITDYNAAVAGFEYTFIGIADSAQDIGLVVEYQWDERGTKHLVAGQNDIAIAARFVMNDIDSSEILAGITQDLDFSGSRSLFVEASTRIGESTKVALDMFLFTADDTRDISYQLINDDFIQLSAEWYF